VPVESRAGDSESPGNGSDAFPLGLTSLGDSQHVLSNDGRTSTGTPLSLGGIQTSTGALYDHVPLPKATIIVKKNVPSPFGE
jgi:hypothetical protein